MILPKLIVFFGPDGSGKSTQCNLVVEHLMKKGLKVKKTWIRSPHTLAYYFAQFLISKGFVRTKSNPYGLQMTVPLLRVTPSLQRIWPWIELASILPLVFLRVYIPRVLGFTVVAERYVIDSVVNISYYLSDPCFYRNIVAKILIGFLPKDAILIHIDSDYQTMLMRRGQAVDPEDFIDFQRTEYAIIKKSLNAFTINTSHLDIQQAHAKILEILEKS
jgi:hypothetical protein